MKYLQVTTAILLCSLSLALQAASPKPSGFLADYDRLVEGEYLEAYWIDMPRIERIVPRQVTGGR